MASTGTTSNRAIRSIESFNGRLRDEFLNETLFSTLAQARIELEEWRRDCNINGPTVRSAI